MNGRFARISARLGSALRSCSSPSARPLREDPVLIYGEGTTGCVVAARELDTGSGAHCALVPHRPFVPSLGRSRPLAVPTVREAG